MIFIPYKRIIKENITFDEFDSFIQEKNNLILSKEYIGNKINNGFIIRRNITPSFISFIPVLIGNYEVTENKNYYLKIQICLPKLISIFLIIYIIFSSTFFILKINSHKNSITYIEKTIGINEYAELIGEDNFNKYYLQNNNNNNILFQLFYVILPYIISIIIFNIEFKRLKNDFKSIDFNK